MKQNTDEQRLTEQLWRSYKLKYTVLEATLVGLWLLFSAVRTGQQAAYRLIANQWMRDRKFTKIFRSMRL